MGEGAQLADSGDGKCREAAVGLLGRSPVFLIDQNHIGGNTCSLYDGRPAHFLGIDFDEIAACPVHYRVLVSAYPKTSQLSLHHGDDGKARGEGDPGQGAHKIYL
jgi:hypothetical protein